MDEGAKRRLVGAAVLVALAVIFVPMLLDDKQTDGLGEPIVIPDEPDFDAAYDTSVEPAEQDLTPPLPIPEPPPGATVDSDQATADMASPASARPIPETNPTTHTHIRPPQNRVSAEMRGIRNPECVSLSPTRPSGNLMNGEQATRPLVCA